MRRNFDFFLPLQKLLGVHVYTRPLLGPSLVESCSTELCNIREAELNSNSVTVLDKYVSLSGPMSSTLCRMSKWSLLCQARREEGLIGPRRRASGCLGHSGRMSEPTMCSGCVREYLSHI